MSIFGFWAQSPGTRILLNGLMSKDHDYDLWTCELPEIADEHFLRKWKIVIVIPKSVYLVPDLENQDLRSIWNSIIPSLSLWSFRKI